MDDEASPRGYAYHDALASRAHDYLLPAVLRIRLRDLRFGRVGRIPPLAKSMISIARRS